MAANECSVLKNKYVASATRAKERVAAATNVAQFFSRPNVPKFGNWEGGDDVPYTVYFDKARQGRTTGKMINPNDPQENPELFSKNALQTQLKPEEPIARGPVRPNPDSKTSRKSSEFKHFSESPARGARPIRQSIGSENSFEKSPHLLHYQAKVAGKVGISSPAWDGKSSYDSSYGTPERSRMKGSNRGHETPDRGATVPKFGEWDENDPSSGDGYSQIFNKVREERHNGSAESPNRINEPSYAPGRNYNDDDRVKSCCFPWGRK